MCKREVIKPRYDNKWKPIPLAWSQATTSNRQGKSRWVPPGSESMASLRVRNEAYLGGLAYPTGGYLAHKEHGSEVLEKACKESDRFIVPMKLVMTAEGRGRHVIAFLSKT